MSQLWTRSKTNSMSQSTSNTKRIKPDEPSNSPTSDVTNNELARMITNQNKILQARMDKLEDELHSQLSKGLDEIKAELSDVNTRLRKVEAEQEGNAESIARTLLTDDLTISGVPYTVGEDLQHYFRYWCLTRSPLNAGSNCLILMQFAFTNQRNDFFSKYLAMRSLNLAQIGFQANKRVYVNESLTPAARKIKAKAIELKKQGKLAYAFSKGGVIYVKELNSEDNVVVKSMEELQRFHQR
uniref:Putative cpij015144 conserved protein n=1 Tax=Aedes albopictus TaxID=7160 RepID=A0A023EKR2_AEDAL